jgi:hypothetical protein
MNSVFTPTLPSQSRTRLPSYPLRHRNSFCSTPDLAAGFRYRRSIGDQNLYLSKFADDISGVCFGLAINYPLPKTVKS